MSDQSSQLLDVSLEQLDVFEELEIERALRHGEVPQTFCMLLVLVRARDEYLTNSWNFNESLKWPPEQRTHLDEIIDCTTKHGHELFLGPKQIVNKIMCVRM
uniref:Uncharacterized protein n=1 Tax=Pristionchus pacificus TaxID=54126 RepID=A0A2A6BU44_PRIPA|eukprot:PDM69326.1 hypothetical protein PRIPAC_47628 [Pristionchus pacificus]